VAKQIEEETQAIKSSSDLAAIVAAYGVQLNKQGAQLVGLCPFHEEKSPSFRVSPEKQVFLCFGCDASGDVFDFVKQIETCSFAEAKKKVAQLSAGGKMSRNGKMTGRKRQPDWRSLYHQFVAAMTPQRLADLATSTDVPEAGWETISPGWVSNFESFAREVSGTNVRKVRSRSPSVRLTEA
jgi:DNA primase